MITLNLLSAIPSNYNETFVFLCLLCVSLFIYKLFRNITNTSYKLPPGPTGLPIVGYLPFFGSEPHKTIQNLSEKYGSVFSATCGQKLAVFCNDFLSAEEVLGKSEAFNRPDGLFDGIPNGLGIAGLNGKDWIDQRKFAFKVVKDIGLGKTQWDNLLQEEMSEVIKAIQETKGKVVEVGEILRSTFTNNIMTLMFGNRLPTGHPTTVYFSNVVDVIAETFTVLSPVTFMPRVCNTLVKLGLLGSKEALQKLHHFSRFVISLVDKELKQGIDGETFVKIYEKEIEKQKSVPKTHLTKTSMYGNVQAFLFGGTDTSRTALTWLSLAMAKHPEVQEKVQKELDTVLGVDGQIGWPERSKVPYTYAAIMEVLRWKTVTPLNAVREVAADFKLQGYDIPRGTIIIVNQWAIHHDPKYWPEPRKYKPERFLKDGCLITTKMESYMPFSLGKRDCPGKLIAQLEIFQYFMALMRNFTIKLPEDDVVKYKTMNGLTRQVRNVKLRFVPREYSIQPTVSVFN